jgi:hypothetical protein
VISRQSRSSDLPDRGNSAAMRRGTYAGDGGDSGRHCSGWTVSIDGRCNTWSESRQKEACLGVVVGWKAEGEREGVKARQVEVGS